MQIIYGKICTSNLTETSLLSFYRNKWLWSGSNPQSYNEKASKVCYPIDPLHLALERSDSISVKAQHSSGLWKNALKDNKKTKPRRVDAGLLTDSENLPNPQRHCLFMLLFLLVSDHTKICRKQIRKLHQQHTNVFFTLVSVESATNIISKIHFRFSICHCETQC